MRRAPVLVSACSIVILGGVAAVAQDADSLTRARLGTLLTAAPGTPEGKGLLPTALAEAQTAMAQAGLAEKASEDLAAMQQAAGGVLHALDPALTGGGPGLGYGLRRALEELIAQIEATAAADRKEDVAQVSPRALAAAHAAQQTVEALADAAKRLQSTKSAADAAPLARQMRELAGHVLVGPGVTRDRAPGAIAPVSGLYGVQSSLAVLFVVREGVLPTTLRQPRPQREVPR
jgi:hypothetical protein